MKLSRDQLIQFMAHWDRGWRAYDLEAVLEGVSDDVVFVNWTGGRVAGKDKLRAAWAPWFANNGGFRFVLEDLFADEASQQVLFRWALHWPSPEAQFEGRSEIRRGVDVITFRDGKIREKLTYSQTTIEIDGQRIKLSAQAG
jgi:ketosteroid isomerase-like protein